MENYNETLKTYEDGLRKMVAERVGRVPGYLGCALKVAAQTWMTLDIIHEQLMSGRMTWEEEGYNSQTKTIVNPLLKQYTEMLGKLTIQLEAVGLNFRTAPRKITDPTELAGSGDPIDNLLEGMP